MFGKDGRTRQNGYHIQTQTSVLSLFPAADHCTPLHQSKFTGGSHAVVAAIAEDMVYPMIHDPRLWSPFPTALPPPPLPLFLAAGLSEREDCWLVWLYHPGPGSLTLTLTLLMLLLQFSSGRASSKLNTKFLRNLHNVLPRASKHSIVIPPLYPSRPPLLRASSGCRRLSINSARIARMSRRRSFSGGAPSLSPAATKTRKVQR